MHTPTIETDVRKPKEMTDVEFRQLLNRTVDRIRGYGIPAWSEVQDGEAKVYVAYAEQVGPTLYRVGSAYNGVVFSACGDHDCLSVIAAHRGGQPSVISIISCMTATEA